ncbi:hypothetical protein B0T22DRAFT_476566 [Podospora appendiculata]|uniref:Uncharacterized protein n=1 Tax=Podospora appendiculata TaxID=314037 RepID=A0AAE0XI71_9PEZI|nr:hypothetical protein B0T22DRAFT_476566 [Podospora appendiculata]
MASDGSVQQGYSPIHVGSSFHVQTAEDRFGSHVLDDLKAFVLEGPNFNGMMDPDDDDDDDGEEDEDDEDDDDDWDGIAEPEGPNEGDMAFDEAPQPQPQQQDHNETSPDANHQGFPRLARTRNNLTALSQRFNLYFTAYQDKIYVYQPRKAPHILPYPSMIIHPKRTKVARLIGGRIDKAFGHQVNHIIVGNLGSFEVVFFAYDDGDVGAYYTHDIARSILAYLEPRHGVGGARLPPPKEFFHENIGLSAWGLAIHEKSRLLAVSSNRYEVTVFAFAMTKTSRTRIPSDETEVDDSPKVWSGQTALELEKHFNSRTRTWRIVLPLGPQGHNIPNIAFCDDEEGNASEVVAVDIRGNTWILDIWKIGSSPIQYPQTANRAQTRALANQPYTGWGVLVLPDSNFKQTASVRELLGLPGREVLLGSGSRISPGPIPEMDLWLDTTCSLFYVKDMAPSIEFVLRHRHGTLYQKIHAEEARKSAHEPAVEEDDDDTDMSDADDTPHASTHELESVPSEHAAERRWAAIRKTHGPPGSAINDISDEVQLSRTIVPSFGETPPPATNLGKCIEFFSSSVTRQANTKPIQFPEAELRPHMVKTFSILRTTCTDIELQPVDPRGTGILCKSVLAHHNHHLRRVEPWDLNRQMSERVSMLLHVPELNLVVAGALNGRVALLTLTKTAKRLDGVPLRRGFRVDWVLPRLAEEEKKKRPWCALHGIAMSPVPDPKAQGLDLHGRESRVSPVVYRLILHYMNHTIVTYDVMRREGGAGELLIF